MYRSLFQVVGLFVSFLCPLSLEERLELVLEATAIDIMSYFSGGLAQ